MLLHYYYLFIVVEFQLFLSGISENEFANEIHLNSFVGVTECPDDSLDGQLASPVYLQIAEAFIFATKQINNDNSLIPNISLKLELHDTCNSLAKSLATGYSFEYFKTASSGNIVGLQGDSAIGLSVILNNRPIPQISFVPISDYLANRFKVFSIAPSQETEMKVIAHFIYSQKWTLFSLVYARTMFVERNTLIQFKKIIEKMHLCIATSIELNTLMEDYDYKKVINKLLNNDVSRVVVLISGPREMRGIFKAVHDLGADGKFFWIGSSGWAGRTTSLPPEYRNSVIGSLTVSPHALPVKEFENHLSGLKPRALSSKWLNETWELVFNCSLSARTCKEHLRLTDSPEFPFSNQAVYAIDAVYVMAHAFHASISSHCTNEVKISDCLRNQETAIFRYIESVSFKGFTGNVHFNDRRRTTDYVIRQVSPFISNRLKELPSVVEKVVKIVRVDDYFSMQDVFAISWNFQKQPNSRSDEPGTSVEESNKISQSRCFKLCGNREVRRFKKASCCWDCFRCKDYEIFISNLTQCKSCDKNLWPDESTNYTTCISIEPLYPTIDNPLFVIILLAFGVFGIISTCGVFFFYLFNWNVRVIKASSRELSILQLGAILVGYLTDIFQMVRPSDSVCTAIFFLLYFSFNSLYTSMLMKTVRIYYIFSSITNRRYSLKGFKPSIQVIISIALIFVQFIIFTVACIQNMPKSKLIQPSDTKKKVLLICQMPSAGLICFACTNLLLILLCSIFARMTRKLPDNFNESHYIAMCVFTMLLIWIVIIPSYVFTAKHIMKYFLIDIALLLNHSVVLILLFFTRVYEVIRVENRPLSLKWDVKNGRRPTSIFGTLN